MECCAGLAQLLTYEVMEFLTNCPTESRGRPRVQIALYNKNWTRPLKKKTWTRGRLAPFSFALRRSLQYTPRIRCWCARSNSGGYTRPPRGRTADDSPSLPALSPPPAWTCPSRTDASPGPERTQPARVDSGDTQAARHAATVHRNNAAGSRLLDWTVETRKRRATVPKQRCAPRLSPPRRGDVRRHRGRPAGGGDYDGSSNHHLKWYRTGDCSVNPCEPNKWLQYAKTELLSYFYDKGHAKFLPVKGPCARALTRIYSRTHIFVVIRKS